MAVASARHCGKNRSECTYPILGIITSLKRKQMEQIGNDPRLLNLNVILNDMLPPARSYLLSLLRLLKQYHQLGIKYPNVTVYGGYSLLNHYTLSLIYMYILFQYNAVFFTMALLYSLKSYILIPLAVFSLLRIASSMWLCVSMWFWNFSISVKYGTVIIMGLALEFWHYSQY